jgi:ankyrin repeat protein
MNGDLHMMDNSMMKPAHFAAACSNPENIKLLVAKGASLTDIDRSKKTPMHVAAMARRSETLRYLMEQNKELIT